MFRAGLIQKLTSPYAAATVLNGKEDKEGNLRERKMCGDYPALNAVTEMMAYLMPTPEEIFHSIRDARYFTKLDLGQGFHQIAVEEADKPKTAFWGEIFCGSGNPCRLA